MMLTIANIVMMALLSVSICVTCILASVQMQRLKGMYDKHQDKREFDKELNWFVYYIVLIVVQLLAMIMLGAFV